MRSSPVLFLTAFAVSCDGFSNPQRYPNHIAKPPYPTSASSTPTTSSIASATSSYAASYSNADGTWAFAKTSASYDNFSALPDDIDPFYAYKKIFASTENTTLAWWYMGLSSVVPDGLPETPGLKSQTIQAFRVQHLSPEKMRIDWTEIVDVADFQSGEDASTFYNPLVGSTTNVSNYYYDGPVTYYVTKNGSNIDLEIVQANATIIKTSVVGYLVGDMIVFYHLEVKVRNIVEETTQTSLIDTLMPIGKLADVRNPNITMAPARGNYYAYFYGSLSSIFGFADGAMGATHIMGNIDKGRADEAIYPALWERYQEKFPEFFVDGVISPNWTATLGADA